MADQGSEGLLSPFLRRRRFRAVRPFLRGRILDVGCGSGELARYCCPEEYVGVDIDADVLSVARRNFPGYSFGEPTFPREGQFDTITAVAVIEHLPDPAQFLKELAERLAETPDAAIVCTTPHPTMERTHRLGAALGLFSKSASEEHKEMLDRTRLEEIGSKAGLRMTHYERFLLGANQLVVFSRAEER